MRPNFHISILAREIADLPRVLSDATLLPTSLASTDARALLSLASTSAPCRALELEPEPAPEPDARIFALPLPLAVGPPVFPISTARPLSRALALALAKFTLRSLLTLPKMSSARALALPNALLRSLSGESVQSLSRPLATERPLAPAFERQL